MVQLERVNLYQRHEYNGIKRDLDTCPFDEGGFGTQDQYRLDENRTWLWLVNPFPYWRYQTMLIPKRHVERIEELTPEEFMDFQSQITYAMSRYSALDLRHPDGDPVKNYVMLWRTREKNQPNGVKILDHLHVHIAPDKEGRWDPILEDDAYRTDISLLR